MFDLSLLYNLLSVSTDTLVTLAAFVRSLKIRLFRFSPFISPRGTFQQHKPVFERRFQPSDKTGAKILSIFQQELQVNSLLLLRAGASPCPILATAMLLSLQRNNTNTGKKTMEIKHVPSRTSVKMTRSVNSGHSENEDLWWTSDPTSDADLMWSQECHERRKERIKEREKCY